MACKSDAKKRCFNGKNSKVKNLKQQVFVLQNKRCRFFSINSMFYYTYSLEPTSFIHTQFYFLHRKN